jgi:hypothetical protein
MNPSPATMLALRRAPSTRVGLAAAGRWQPRPLPHLARAMSTPPQPPPLHPMAPMVPPRRGSFLEAWVSTFENARAGLMRCVMPTLAACLSALSVPACLFCPACPSTGRARGSCGACLLSVPVHRTSLQRWTGTRWRERWIPSTLPRWTGTRDQQARIARGDGQAM